MHIHKRIYIYKQTLIKLIIHLYTSSQLNHSILTNLQNPKICQSSHSYTVQVILSIPVLFTPPHLVHPYLGHSAYSSSQY